MRLSGTVSMVTGAGRGIGREIALAQAREGAAVALFARSAHEIEAVAQEIIAVGGRATAEAVDLVDLPAVIAAVERAATVLGPIDLLMNNAGSFVGLGPVWEVDPAAWWHDIEVNLRGTFNCCRAVVGGMRERGHGRVVNMVGGGAANSFPNGSGYAVSKSGLMRFTECLSDELADSGVLAFAMDPGLVRTRMTELQLSSDAGRRWTPHIEGMFRDNIDVSPTLAARLAVDLAAGRFDRLRGRLIKAADDLDAIAAATDGIVAGDLRMLRISGLTM